MQLLTRIKVRILLLIQVATKVSYQSSFVIQLLTLYQVLEFNLCLSSISHPMEYSGCHYQV